jgi:uncharacterized RDD family membrane protein YckC
MAAQIQFETPENVQISYEPAGLGTRFLAWFADWIVLGLLMFFLTIGLVCAGIVTDQALQQFSQSVNNFGNPANTPAATPYVLGVMTLVFGLGSFFYFWLSELCLRGQTFGKRQTGLRVVKADGFALDGTSLLVRNAFRVIDNIPIFWICCLVNARGQRLGDLIAGTVVVADKPEEIGSLREVLLQRPPAEARFRFDAATLARARPEEVRAIEAILERLKDVPDEKRQALLDQAVGPFALRLKREVPEPAERLAFLEDFLAAEYRRQYRKLG